MIVTTERKARIIFCDSCEKVIEPGKAIVIVSAKKVGSNSIYFLSLPYANRDRHYHSWEDSGNCWNRPDGDKNKP